MHSHIPRLALFITGALQNIFVKVNPNAALDHIIPHGKTPETHPAWFYLMTSSMYCIYRHRIAGRGTVHTLAWCWDSRNSTRANRVQLPVVTPSFFTPKC